MSPYTYVRVLETMGKLERSKMHGYSLELLCADLGWSLDLVWVQVWGSGFRVWVDQTSVSGLLHQLYFCIQDLEEDRGHVM